MSQNLLIIRDVVAMLEQFESKPDSELIRHGYQKLESVKIHAEPNPAARLKVRAAASAAWIRMLNVTDAVLPADFDPEQTVPLKPELPAGQGGQPKYPPGTDPQTIRDQQDRSEYIKAITDHRNEQELYRVRMHLYRINEQLSESARNYFILAYQGTRPEQEELKKLLERGLKREDRKAAFLKYVRL